MTQPTETVVAPGPIDAAGSSEDSNPALVEPVMGKGSENMSDPGLMSLGGGDSDISGPWCPVTDGHQTHR